MFLSRLALAWDSNCLEPLLAGTFETGRSRLVTMLPRPEINMAMLVMGVFEECISILRRRRWPIAAQVFLPWVGTGWRCNNAEGVGESASSDSFANSFRV